MSDSDDTGDSPPEPRNRLHGTSQGKRTDFPPKDWIPSELELFGAVKTGKKWKPNLTGKLHPFFEKERWPDIIQERFDVLEQSFQLSTRLLKAAGPFLCNFLPDPKFRGKDPKRLEVNNKRSAQEIVVANAMLVDIAYHVQWREKDFADDRHADGVLGANHADPMKTDTGNTGEDDRLIAWDSSWRKALRAGLRHRRVNISITNQFVDALLTTEKGSDGYMVVTFAAAQTMVHEFGHTLYYHDLRYRTKGMWVGDDIGAETGRSFIGWLFDGWQPEIYNSDSGIYDERKTFIGWSKHFRKPAAMPREYYIYSAPITHIQRMLDQSEWSKFDFRGDPCASSRKCRSELLRPKTPFRIGEHARTGILVHHIYSRDHCDGWTGDYRFEYDPEYLPIDEDWDDDSKLRKSPSCSNPDNSLTDPASRSISEPEILGRPDPSSKNRHDFYIPYPHEPGDESEDTEDPLGGFMYEPSDCIFGWSDIEEPLKEPPKEPPKVFKEATNKTSKANSSSKIAPKARSKGRSPRKTLVSPKSLQKKGPSGKRSRKPTFTPPPAKSPKKQASVRRILDRHPHISELSTVRSTRSKRKVAKLDNDALEDFGRKRRKEGTRDDSVSLSGSASDTGKGKQVENAGPNVMSGGKKRNQGGRKK